MIETSDQELAALYALDLLAIDRREEFERAMRVQPHLRQLARDLQEVTDTLALECPRQLAPEGIWDRIHHQVQWDQERERAHRQLRRRTHWTWAGWAAAACLAAAWCLSVIVRTTESARSSAATDAWGERVGPRPSPALSDARQGMPGHDATSSSNKANAASTATDRTNRLQAELNAARARERQWSEALAATLGQITNLAVQLEMQGTSPPGTRRVSWVALAPPGQAQLAEQALDTILNRLPSVLTNLVNTSPDTPGSSNANGVRFESRIDSPLNPSLPQDNPTAARPDKEIEANANSPKPATGRESQALGVAFWDGRSPTMTVALTGIPEPPVGYEWLVTSVDGNGKNQLLGRLAVASPEGNSGPVQIPVIPGWANGTPNLAISLGVMGAQPSFHGGAVLIGTPPGP